MTKIEKIELEIRELNSEELAVLREWFLKYDADAWDRQIERDAAAGKLDRLAEEPAEGAASGLSSRAIPEIIRDIKARLANGL
ncbi:MAG: hypothetical protein ACKVOI_13175 [Dongiaceae bacterium]